MWTIGHCDLYLSNICHRRSRGIFFLIDGHINQDLNMKGLINQFCFVSWQANQEAKRDLQLQLEEQLSESRAIKDIVSEVKEVAGKNSIAEHEVIYLVC